jgi:hypothetical protein
MADTSNTRAWSLGGVVFAGTMMIMAGIWQGIVGIAAIVDEEFFVEAPNYTYEIDTVAWGWVHLILGVIVFLAGWALFTGVIWARLVGIVLAVLVGVNNFLFLPHYPLWSIVAIALAVFVVWALATAPRHVVTSEPARYEPTRQ